VVDAKWWEKVKEIFNHTLDLSLEERKDFLAEACATDDELCRESRRATRRARKGWEILSDAPFR
jgi:hypothetical protein